MSKGVLLLGMTLMYGGISILVFHFLPGDWKMLCILPAWFGGIMFERELNREVHK